MRALKKHRKSAHFIQKNHKHIVFKVTIFNQHKMRNKATQSIQRIIMQHTQSSLAETFKKNNVLLLHINLFCVNYLNQ